MAEDRFAGAAAERYDAGLREWDDPARVGARLRERWSGWQREQLTSESTAHVSVWEKPE